MAGQCHNSFRQLFLILSIYYTEKFNGYCRKAFNFKWNGWKVTFWFVYFSPIYKGNVSYFQQQWTDLILMLRMILMPVFIVLLFFPVHLWRNYSLDCFLTRIITCYSPKEQETKKKVIFGISIVEQNIFILNTVCPTYVSMFIRDTKSINFGLKICGKCEDETQTKQHMNPCLARASSSVDVSSKISLEL